MFRKSDISGILPIAAVAIVLTGCANEKIWSYDEEAEVSNGSTQHSQILKQIGAYNNTKLSDYVNAIGNKIAASSDRPNLQWKFTVIDSAIPNAFATQGGYVYITRGMLALLQSEAELAAVLAHETGHICAQDTPYQQAVGNLMGLGVLGTIAAAPALLLFPQIAAAPEGAGMAAISRKAEFNADQLGAKYLERAGFPPETMQTAMDMLASMESYERQQQKNAGYNPSSWWHRLYASHPATEKRQEKLSNVAEPHNPIITSVPDSEFLSHLDGLEFGSSKSEGIPYGNKLYFSEWEIAIKVPDGWNVRHDYKGNQLWLFSRETGARLQIQRMTLTQIDKPCEWLSEWMRPITVTDTKPAVTVTPSCTAIAHKSVPTLFSNHDYLFRTGIISASKVAGNGWLFRGYSKDNNNFAKDDEFFLAAAQSIESLLTTDKKPRPTILRIQRSKPGDSFSSLASSSRIKGNNAENLLRLLNRHYPDGEPKTNELIKVIE